MRIQTGGKFLLIIILVAIVLVGAGVGTFYAIHHSKSTEELASLESAGFVHLTNMSENLKMNVAVKGSTSPKHTFITIAGMGHPDYGVYMDYITNSLQKDNRLVIIDRLGTGYSDDTKAERTANVIVEEYRAALQKNMIDAPYVLLAHEIGAAYATHWQNTYPNEIEGIIYIDPNPIDSSYSGLKLPENIEMLSIGYKFGVQRIMYDKIYTPEAVRMPQNYGTAASYFNAHSVYTTGHLAEASSALNNMSSTFGAIQTNNIPKMYINSSYAFETKEEALEYIDYCNAQARSVGQEKVYPNTDGAAEKLVATSQAMTATINSYVNKLGNCHLVKMPGGPDVYQQHHGILEAAIVDFINFLDGTTHSLKDRYTDRVLDEWQQMQDQELVEQEEVTEPPTEIEIETES